LMTPAGFAALSVGFFLKTSSPTCSFSSTTTYHGPYTPASIDHYARISFRYPLTYTRIRTLR
jgi:hypothetical protein